MKPLTIVLFAFSLLLLGCTPKTLEKTSSASISNEEQTAKFPEGWLGQWSGTLDIIRGAGKVQSLPMKMQIQATDKEGEYNWLTTFGDKAETAKPYLLKTVDAANGLYIIDEQNSIVIETYLFDNKLVSWYVVQGNLILASFEKRGANIVFEILAGTEKEVSITGETEVDGEAIPAVKTLPFNVMQRATLTREK